ncbi:MAG: class I SAM-dependent methyltransferase [Candidatus Margulisiibacteriota bacterium]
MKIRTYKPDHRVRVNPQLRIAVVVKLLHGALGYLPKLNLDELAEISVVLYQQDVEGPYYNLLRDLWDSSSEFSRIKEKAGSPRVRKLMAEICAYVGLKTPSDPNMPGTARNAFLALYGISKHFPQNMEIDAVVLGAGNPGINWVEFWPESGSLTLIDKNPYIAELLEACVGFYQKENVSVLEGDIFDLTGPGKLFNVVHAGNLTGYLDDKQLKRFFKFTASLLPKERDQRLIIIQTSYWRAYSYFQTFKADIYKELGFKIVEKFVESDGEMEFSTIFYN